MAVIIIANGIMWLGTAATSTGCFGVKPASGRIGFQTDPQYRDWPYWLSAPPAALLREVRLTHSFLMTV